MYNPTDELRKEMNQRFDRLEEKLDKYAIESAETKQDIVWLKGFIRTGTSFIVAIITAIIGAVIHLFIGK